MDPKQTLPPFFYEIFDASLPRLGPGDANSTQRAAQLALKNISASKIRALDIGCGNGTPTLELAKHVDGTILAVDNHQPFLDELWRRAEVEKVSEKIKPCLGSMFNLELDDGSFDLIWSEGALYMMGIHDALKTCHRLLKPNGVLGVSDMVWFQPDPPKPCKEFLEASCPFLVDIDTNMATMDDCGYEVLDHFSLPESAWWDSFYHPLEDRLGLLRGKHADDPEKMALIEAIQEEIEICRSYLGYYGYEFFVLRRR